MVRRRAKPLLLCVAMLAGCNFEAVPIGSQAGDAALSAPTQDEQLATYGELLEGTWRGVPDVKTILYEDRVGVILRWMPDADPPRSGTLDIRCVDDGVDCLPGGRLFRYSLYEIRDQTRVKGALEVAENMGQVEGLATLELTFQGAELVTLVASAGSPVIPFVTISGTFVKDPPPVVVPPSPGR